MASYRFSRSERLRASKTIRHIYTHGVHVTYEWVVLSFKRRPCTGNNQAQLKTRMAVIVPKKAIQKATQRNIFKRVTREFMRNNKHTLSFPCDIIIRPRITPEHFSATEILRVIKGVFLKTQRIV